MKKWSEKTTLEKVAEVIIFIAVGAWLVFEFLEHKTDAEYATNGGYICLWVMCLAEVVSYWNERRVFSYVALAGAAIMMAVFVWANCFI